MSVEPSFGADPPPLYSEPAEQAVLGAMFLDMRAISAAQEILSPECFYRPSHATLFRVMGELCDGGSVVDPLTVIEALNRVGALDHVGGRDYISYLIDVVPTAANVRHHADIVREFADRRELIATAHALEVAARNRMISVKCAAQAATEALLPSAAATTRQGYRHAWEIAPEVMADFEAAQQGQRLGLPFGYQALDIPTGGQMPGELTFFCAVPGGAKTALALNIAVNAAQHGNGVAIVSAEMQARALVKRLVTNRAQVDSLSIRSGNFNEQESTRLGRALGELKQLPLWVDDTALPDIHIIQARARALKVRHPTIQWLIVDFIQLVQGGASDDEIRALQLTNIAYALKGLAKELDVAVIATCQVDASGIEKRADKRPQLADLRWSQGMREAADLVALLYRPAMYDSNAEDILELDFKKARDLAPFKTTLYWIGKFMRLEDPCDQR